MNARTEKLSWIAPAVALVISLAMAAWFYSLPDRFTEHHDWPVILAIVAAVLFFYGVGNLFWLAVPQGKTAPAIFGLGIVLTALCWLSLRSIPGVIVGVLVAAIGFAMLILQHRRN